MKKLTIKKFYQCAHLSIVQLYQVDFKMLRNNTI